MKSLVTTLSLVLIILGSANAVAEDILPVCDRTPEVRREIEVITEKSCASITESDLLKIRKIVISHEDFETLKDGDFSGLLNLEILEFFRNRLLKLPSGIFQNLPKLRALWLSENQLRELPPDIFRGLNSLEMISLQNNELTELPIGLFDDLSNLVDLFMDQNQMVTIDPRLWRPLGNLTQISLGSPVLEHIPDDAFLENKKIELVSVFQAPLTRSSPAAFRGVPEVEDLSPTFNVDPEFDWEGL